MSRGCGRGGGAEKKEGRWGWGVGGVIIEWRAAERRADREATAEMKASDYAQGTGDAGTKLRLRCLSTQLHNAFVRADV